MVNYFIYAKDCSGSTRRSQHYHSNGLKTLEQFKCDVKKMKKELSIVGESPTESKIIYLHWGDECWEVNEDDIRATYMEMSCFQMGTKPERIIQWLKENSIVDDNDNIKLLYIITDGMIDTDSVNICFRWNDDMYYEKVVFYAFNKNLNAIDLSVASSFFKKHCIVYRNHELYSITDISKEFDYDRINIDNFEDEKEQLESYIKLRYIRKINNDALALQEIEKLKKLRGRLFVELSSENSKVKLTTKDKNIFLRDFINTDWYKNLIGSAYLRKVDIEKCISTMINYIVSDVKSYSFDSLKYDTEFDKHVEEEEVIDVNFPAEQEIEFNDIILDDDKGIPVVILAELNLLDKIIFHKIQQSVQVSRASFSKFKSTMDCPLFLMNDQDISESIGYFYTLNVYKQLLANNTKTEPRTRKLFHGGLVLTNTDQFDKYNDYVLSATYFNFKKIHYNVGLFYFVLFKNCENKEWMDRNVVEQFKRYAMRRISETVCTVGLSSLPLDPQEKISLLTALWYCVELSSCIFKNDPQNFKQERLRMYYGIAPYMVEILKYFNYDLDLQSIETRRELISHVMILKKTEKHRDKVYYLLERIFKTVEGFLVSKIEKPFNIYKLNYLKLNHKEMLPDDVVEEEVHLNDYVHLMHIVGNLDASEAGEETFEICEKTYRPFFAIDQNKSFYTELVKSTKKVVINNDDDEDKIEVSYETIDVLEFDKILSLYKLFINCVYDIKRYPTFPEYIQFLSRKKKFNEDLITIFPSNVYFDAKDVYARYEKIVTKVEVYKFFEVCKAYVTRTERIKAEERVKFNSDNEISEFISNEELRVNLKKEKQSK